MRRSQLEVVPRNSTAGGRPMSTVSAGGSLGRGSRALHLQHHQSSLSALHMTANHSGTVDRRRSSLRVTYRIDSKTPRSVHHCTGYSVVFYRFFTLISSSSWCRLRFLFIGIPLLSYFIISYFPPYHLGRRTLGNLRSVYITQQTLSITSL